MSLTTSELETLLADVLEHLYDYCYLGAHPLGRLHIVDTLLVHDQTPLTHVDRGRALSRMLQIAIDEMKPGVEPADVGHEARFYHILAHAYAAGKENSQVARDLAISERTFYRERRRAIEALAHVVWDMEYEQ